MKEAGPDLGYARYANAIVRPQSGRYAVRRSGAARRDHEASNDPTANAVMAGVFTQQNAAAARRAARPPGRATANSISRISSAPRGAARLITCAGEQPNASAAESFPPRRAPIGRSSMTNRDARAVWRRSMACLPAATRWRAPLRPPPVCASRHFKPPPGGTAAAGARHRAMTDTFRRKRILLSPGLADDGPRVPLALPRRRTERADCTGGEPALERAVHGSRVRPDRFPWPTGKPAARSVPKLRGRTCAAFSRPSPDRHIYGEPFIKVTGRLTGALPARKPVPVVWRQ